MARYKCWTCESEHGTDNMVAHCAACVGRLTAELEAAKAVMTMRHIEDGMGYQDGNPNHSICPPKYSWQLGHTAVVKQGWFEAGREFDVLGPAVYVGQWWVPVWDRESDEPCFYKEACLSPCIKERR